MEKEKEENLVLDYDIARMSRMRPFVKVRGVSGVLKSNINKGGVE